MFSSSGLFSKTVCPEGSECCLLNCIFSHASSDTYRAPLKSRTNVDNAKEHTNSEPREEGRPRKKRRSDEDGNYVTPDSETFAETSVLLDGVVKTIPSSSRKTNQEPSSGPPLSAIKDVSPPPVRSQKSKAESGTPLKGGSSNVSTTFIAPDRKTANGKQESLNPRLMNKPPATHAIRLKLLIMLHEQMNRLNEEVMGSQDPSKAALELTPQELIVEALGEEEKIAKENSSVYANLVKLRIVALRRMNLEGWRKERLAQIAREYPKDKPLNVPSVPAPLKTGLSSAEELALLPRLVSQQDGLIKHGYIPIMPSEAEIEKARIGVEAAQGWEQCDRCKSRFQVFPGRRAEDGALTTGGRCFYHHGKPRRPAREKADTGHKDPVYLCCGQALGTSGCTTAETHVFKISEAKRLAAVLQFKRTPVEALLSADHAVCFDCEMGYTTLGMELIRLTATSWPDGGELIDILVRPLGEILDLNSRYSGVWPKHFKEAIPYEEYTRNKEKVTTSSKMGEMQLPLVDSPVNARELLFGHLTTMTPLIGHAIENDLNAVRIIHPTIIDTVLLYPHPRGLPMRYGLKVLVKNHLNRNIQTGGAQGHDSKEDARAAGDLVRLKVGETWKSMTRDGWTVRNEVFYPPLASD